MFCNLCTVPTPDLYKKATTIEKHFDHRKFDEGVAMAKNYCGLMIRHLESEKASGRICPAHCSPLILKEDFETGLKGGLYTLQVYL